MDIKLMVIRRISERPELANRIFLEVGRRELRLIVNFGFFFGLALGFPMVFITEALPYWYVLPIGGVMIGYVTNWVALWMIFAPVTEHRICPLRLHGLLLRRQPLDAMRESLASDAVEYTMTPLTDPEFNRRQSGEVRRLIADRMRELPSRDFSELLRSAMREDEWLLLLHGAVLGFAAGLLHLAIFGPG